MRTIAIANQKGGVGKSTTAINIAAGLSICGKSVLLVDMDHQGNSTKGLNISTKDVPTVAEVLCDENLDVRKAIQKTYIPNLEIIPSDLSLAIAEMKLSSMSAKEFKLRKKLSSLKYDYIIIDCPPSFGPLTINSFLTATEIIMPVKLNYFSLEGVDQFLEVLTFINEDIGSVVNHRIDITGVVITFLDLRSKLARNLGSTLSSLFTDKMYNTSIPLNVKLDEAQSEGKSIFDHAPESSGAIAYKNLTNEILERNYVKT